jgi:hypothetical protein
MEKWKTGICTQAKELGHQPGVYLLKVEQSPKYITR